MNRQQAANRLEAYLANPKARTIEEGAPVIILKHGTHLMVEQLGNRYTVSEDRGCTCYERARNLSLMELLDFVLNAQAQENARNEQRGFGIS